MRISTYAMPLCVVLLCLLNTGAAECEEREQPLVTVFPCEETPTIDGDLSDKCWSECMPVQNFSVLTGTAPSRHPTEARITYDNRFLYIGVRCDSSAPPQSEQSKQDHPEIWKDDHIEISLNPTPENPTYFHFQINSKGAYLDEVITGYEPRDTSWNVELKIEVSTSEEGYTVEAAFPFAGLDHRPDNGSWGLNICRGTNDATELSCWSRVQGTFYAPERFGTLAFGGQAPSTRLVDSDPLPTFPGSHIVELSFLPRETKELGARIVTRVLQKEGTTTETSQTIRTYQDSAYQTSVPVVVSDTASAIQLEVVELPSKQLILSTGVFPLRKRRSLDLELQPLQSALKRLESLPASERIEEVSANGYRTLTEAEESEELYRTYFTTVAPSRDEWNQLLDTTETVKRKVLSSRIIAETLINDVQAGRKPRGYATLLVSPMTKIPQAAVPSGIVDGTVTIDLARGEYESAQFTLWPFETDLNNVTVKINNLIHEQKKGVILAEDIQIHRVGFVDCRPPEYAPDITGSVPDPLFPYEPFSVKVGTHQPVWLTLHVSRTVPSGNYHGSIEIRADGQPKQEIPFRVHVYNFNYEETHLKTAFSFSEGAVQSWYDIKGSRLPQSLRREYYEFLLSYRLNPTNIYSSEPRPSKDDIDFCLERGMNGFNVKHIPRGVSWTDDYQKHTLDFFDSYYPFLKEKDLLDIAYCYSFDEPNPEHYPQIQKIFGLLGSKYPGLLRATTEAPADPLKECVDIFIPLTSEYEKDTARTFQAIGDEVWWYVCLQPKHPYANFFVDYQGIDHRVLFWQTWKYNVTGFLYYATNLWRTNLATKPTSNIVPFENAEYIEMLKEGKRWPEVPWNSYTYTRHNGDGHLFYPGPDGSPLPSIRLALIRDGIEDYEYHYLLRQRLKSLVARGKRDSDILDLTDRASKLLNVPSGILQNLTEYTNDPEIIMQQRRRIAETIEEMDGVLRRLR